MQIHWDWKYFKINYRWTWHCSISNDLSNKTCKMYWPNVPFCNSVVRSLCFEIFESIDVVFPLSKMWCLSLVGTVSVDSFFHKLDWNNPLVDLGSMYISIFDFAILLWVHPGSHCCCCMKLCAIVRFYGNVFGIWTSSCMVEWKFCICIGKLIIICGILNFFLFFSPDIVK